MMNKLVVIEYLEGLSDGSIEPSLPGVGTCTNLTQKFGYQAVDQFSKLSIEWEKFSGDKTFPVPHPEMTSENAYYHVNLWTGEYGDNRRELCAFVAKRMREELE